MMPIVLELFRNIIRPRVLACWFGATSVAAFTGPFGTFDTQAPLDRLLYWALVIGVAIVMAYAARTVLAHAWPARRRAFSEALATAVFVSIYSPVLWWITTVWFDGTQALPVTFPALMVFVLVLASSASVIIVISPGGGSQMHEDRAVAAARPLPRLIPPLLMRLPEDSRGEILAICASDHYVHVFSERGRISLLMRFADAIAEVGDLEGLRVHRSHWVARAAVSGQRRSNGRLVLVLKNGVEVPVSRSYRADVERLFTRHGAPA